MELKKLHVGTVSYGSDSMEEVAAIVAEESHSKSPSSTPAPTQRGRREINSRVKDAVFALAVCHNVTPTLDEESDTYQYQASSPDEIAIVQWSAAVGLKLIHRDRQSLKLQTASGETLQFNILKMFPFTSESKRMGIVVRTDNDEIWFFMKGADTVMRKLVVANDWMDEECANMAREGLRTLVIGRRRLTEELWSEFDAAFQEADTQLSDRDIAKAAVVSKYLEYGLEILGITGVEDKLQDEVKSSLELLRNAGIKIWMLTGDKVETAQCVAVSSKLVGRGQYIHSVTKGNAGMSLKLRSVTAKRGALDQLEFLKNKPDACLLIDGESLQVLAVSAFELIPATSRPL
jgi:phospholipid-translocating ATPase